MKPFLHIPRNSLLSIVRSPRKYNTRYSAFIRQEDCRQSRRFQISHPVQLWGNRALQDDPEGSSAAKEKNQALFRGPETSESKLFTLGSSLATRMTSDREIECTEIDEKGEIVMGHGHIKKSDLVKKYEIQARDLRKIDESQLPAILVRKSTILANFLTHRVLITHNRVLILHVFQTSKEDANHASSFMYGIQGKLQLGSMGTHAISLPYELRALETILLMVVSELDIMYEEMKKPVDHVLEELGNDVNLDKLKKLLDVSKQLGAFQQKVKLVRNALHTVLEADDDMAAMYLSEKMEGKPRPEANHEEVELLLENYYEASGEIVEKTEKLISDVDYTHDNVKSILDSHRNSIIMLDVNLSVAMLSLAVGTYVAGLYGMNLINGLEDAPRGFTMITSGSMLGMVAVGLFGAHMLRSIRKVYRVRRPHTGRREKKEK